MKNQSFLKRLGFACTGISATLRGEASFQTQVVLGLAAVVMIAFLRPPLMWLALCILSAGFVFALELANTALEHLADRLHPERHDAIQRAKDCAAGAVLIASIVAVLIGALTICVSVGWLTDGLAHK